MYICFQSFNPQKEKNLVLELLPIAITNAFACFGILKKTKFAVIKK